MAVWSVMRPDGTAATINTGRRRPERKREVLEELQAASWMKQQGWSDDEIAAHYQRDRDARACGLWERRNGR